MYQACSRSGDDFIVPARTTLVYVAGPISPTIFAPNFEQNIKSLHETTRKLFLEGFSVYCPAQAWLTLEMNYEHIMQLCFRVLKHCDVIYMTPGWRESRGAVREHTFAWHSGISAIYTDVAPHDPYWDAARWIGG